MMSVFSKGLTLWGFNEVVKIQKSRIGKYNKEKVKIFVCIDYV